MKLQLPHKHDWLNFPDPPLVQATGGGEPPVRSCVVCRKSQAFFVLPLARYDGLWVNIPIWVVQAAEIRANGEYDDNFLKLVDSKARDSV